MSTTTVEPPVGTPVYGARMWQSFRRFWKGYVVFSGRASRSEYWWAQLAIGIVMLAFSIIVTIVMFAALIAPVLGATASTTSDDPTWLINSLLASMGLMLIAMAPLLLVSLAIALPSYSIQCRRLRDAGYSPLFVLFNLASLGIVPMILCILETKPEGYVPASQRPAAMPYGYAQQPQPYAAQAQPPAQQQQPQAGPPAY